MSRRGGRIASSIFPFRKREFHTCSARLLADATSGCSSSLFAVYFLKLVFERLITFAGTPDQSGPIEYLNG